MSYFTVNQQYAFGVDISRYNSAADGSLGVDFDALARHEPKVSFIGIRAGISWGYQDACYQEYARQAARVGLCILPYHVLYPGEPAQSQMDNFLRIVGEHNLGAVRLVLDVELDFGLPKANITSTLAACLRILEARSGRLPMVYSRASWVELHLQVGDLPQVDWWLAQYRWARPLPLFTPEYPCPPTLPKGVSRWLVHQTAEKAPGIGTPASRYMDYDRWNGSPADVRRYFGEAAVRLCPLDGALCDGRWGSGRRG